MKRPVSKRFFVCAAGIVLGPIDDHIAARHLLEDLGQSGFVADENLVVYSVSPDLQVHMEQLEQHNDSIVNRLQWAALAS